LRQLLTRGGLANSNGLSVNTLTVFVQLFLTERLLKGLNWREIQIDRDDGKGFGAHSPAHQVAKSLNDYAWSYPLLALISCSQ
jgi:hypothetical protein